MLSALGLKHSEWDEIVRACFDVTPNRDTHTHIYGSIDRSMDRWIDLSREITPE